MVVPSTTPLSAAPESASKLNKKSAVDLAAHYKQAGAKCNAAFKHAKSLCKPGASLRAICYQTNDFMEQSSAQIAFPCSVSVNNILCHCAPGDSDPDIVLKEDDLIKIELGTQVESCPALITGCFSLKSGIQSAESIISTTKKATTDLIAALEKGETNQGIVDKVKLPDNYSFIESMMSHRLDQGVLSTDDIILLRPAEGQARLVQKKTFLVGEVWAVDVAVTNHPEGRIKPVPGVRTSIYSRSGTNAPLRLQAARAGFSKTVGKHGNFAFTGDQFAKAVGGQGGAGRAGLVECVTKKVLVPYEQLQVEDMFLAARFLATVYISENGPIMITNPFEN